LLPTPQFYYGMQKGDEIAVGLEPGKALVIKFLTVGEPHPEGFHTVFFELSGQPREVNIRGKSLEVKVAARPKADPARPDGEPKKFAAARSLEKPTL
jgi:pyruvate carboxylase